MVPRRILLLVGSLWELARLFLLLSLLAALFGASGGKSAAMEPWLLLASSGNLLVPAGAVLLAIYPRRYAPLLGLLRLGKVLGLFTLLLLLVSGVTARAGLAVPPLGRTGIPGSAALLIITALDALFLAFLVSFRAGTGDGPQASVRPPPPASRESDVEDIH